jgi:helix-turn-helix protein
VSVACLCVGSRIAHGGGVWTVLALTGERATIEDRAAGQTRSAWITHLLSSPGSGLLDPPSGPPVGAVGPLLANLSEVELRAVCDRAAHVREVLTGYRSGSPDDALADEPRCCYLPGSPMMDRYRAKASELGVSLATLRRWVAAYGQGGEAGLIDHISPKGVIAVLRRSPQTAAPA